MLTKYDYNSNSIATFLSDLEQSGVINSTEFSTIETVLAQKRDYQNTSSYYDNKIIFSITNEKLDNTFSINIQGVNNKTQINFKHDTTRFKTHFNIDQLNNYLKGKAILVNRNLKGISTNVFIQAIPKNFNRTSIKHLKLHPKQEYLIVSNEYLNVRANSDKCKVGGDQLSLKEYTEIRNGYSIRKQNPVFIQKGFSNVAYKIQKYGDFEFFINLFQKKYKQLSAIRRVLDINDVTIGLNEFINHIKNLYENENTGNNIIKLFKEQRNEYPIADAICYYINTCYVKPEKAENITNYIYPFESGFNLIKTKDEIIISPSNEDYSKLFEINILNKNEIIETLNRCKLISNELFTEVKNQMKYNSGSLKFK